MNAWHQLLEAHERAFDHFGGHTREHLYDRTRCVCYPNREGRTVWNSPFKSFADYWGFEARRCRPNRAQTKGKVESGVKKAARQQRVRPTPAALPSVLEGLPFPFLLITSKTELPPSGRSHSSHIVNWYSSRASIFLLTPLPTRLRCERMLSEHRSSLRPSQSHQQTSLFLSSLVRGMHVVTTRLGVRSAR
jgi:hypothetical protein